MRVGSDVGSSLERKKNKNEKIEATRKNPVHCTTQSRSVDQSNQRVLTAMRKGTL